MKIRNGFVSNSSSSSFVLFGISVNANDITPVLLKQRQYTVIGSSMEEGTDVFNIDNEEMLAFLKSCENIYGRRSPFSVYEDLGHGKIDLSKLPKEGMAYIRGGDATQNGSYDMNSLWENYCGEYSEDALDQKKIQLEMEKFMRKEKLEKIEKSI